MGHDPEFSSFEGLHNCTAQGNGVQFGNGRAFELRVGSRQYLLMGRPDNHSRGRVLQQSVQIQVLRLRQFGSPSNGDGQDAG